MGSNPIFSSVVVSGRSAPDVSDSPHVPKGRYGTSCHPTMENSHSGLLRHPAKVVGYGPMGSNPIFSSKVWQGACDYVPNPKPGRVDTKLGRLGSSTSSLLLEGLSAATDNSPRKRVRRNNRGIDTSFFRATNEPIGYLVDTVTLIRSLCRVQFSGSVLWV